MLRKVPKKTKKTLLLCISLRAALKKIVHFVTSVSFSLLIVLLVGVIQYATRVCEVESALTT